MDAEALCPIRNLEVLIFPNAIHFTSCNAFARLMRPNKTTATMRDCIYFSHLRRRTIYWPIFSVAFNGPI